MTSLTLTVVATILLVTTTACAFTATTSDNKSHCSGSTEGNRVFGNQDEVALLFSGFNDVLGPIVNVSFSNPAVLDSIERLHIGALRHPGGTVANYWSLKNATYINPCSLKDQYDYCSFKEEIAAYPPQTFSPKEFVKNIGAKLEPILPASAYRIVFDFNLLTLDDAEMLEQVDVLNQTVPDPRRIKFLELGNEYYLTNHYSHWIPNATVYVTKARKLISRMRQVLPWAKIAFVTARPGSNQGWNTVISEALQLDPSLVDSVTIHDYSAYLPVNHDDSVYAGQSIIRSEAEKKKNYDWEFLLLFGPVRLPQYADYVRSAYGENKTIWMTEFNVGLRRKDDDVSYKVAHTIFAFNYLLTAACSTNKTFEIIFLHMLWAQANVGWGTDQSLVQLPRGKVSEPIAQTSVNAMGVLYSLLNELALKNFSRTTCLSVNGETCQKSRELDGIHGKKHQVDCARGLLFDEPVTGTSKAAMITNGCHQPELAVTLHPFAGRAGASIRVMAYDFWQEMDWTPLSDCSSNVSLWACGADVGAPGFLKPKNDLRWTTPADGSAPTITVPNLSVVFVLLV